MLARWLWAGVFFLLSLLEPPESEAPKLKRPTANEARADTSPEPPAFLVRALRGDPFAGDCTDVTHPWWPFEARRCSYQVDSTKLEVTTATPSADRVARWIVDAMTEIPSVNRLKEADPSAWAEALDVAAQYVENQSSRAFPLDGSVFENFEGPTVYSFRGGVTFGVDGEKSRSCNECACRIASLHREEWCSYVAAKSAGRADASSCLASFGGTRGWNDAWANQCLQIHADAWQSDTNEGFRALFLFVNDHQLAKATPENGDVVQALRKAFTSPHRR